MAIVPIPKWADVLVFGSNLAGIHGAGSAKEAMKWGAVYGRGVGFQGMAYAIPTKGFNLAQSLPLDHIALYVDQFCIDAARNSHLKFWVVQIGCGLAGYTVEQMKPLFAKAPKNCFFAWDMVD